MLVAVNGQRPLLGDAGADAVGAFAVLAPDRAGPQAPFIECLVVGDRAAALDRNAARAGARDQLAAASFALAGPIIFQFL